MTIEGTERIFEPSLVTVVDHETEVRPAIKALSVAARSTSARRDGDQLLPRERLLELTETNDHLTDDKVSVSIFEVNRPFTEVHLIVALR